MNSIPIPGCRHDILGHNLKAIGLLRALATSTEAEHRDADAEGWWDLDTACFHLRSQKYPNEEKLVEFLTHHYRPTEILAAWNKDVGLEESLASKSGKATDWQKANAFSVQVAHKVITGHEAFLRYRESAEDSISSVLDAISAAFVKRDHDNPVFLNKGVAGRAHVVRTYWGYVKSFASQKKTRGFTESALFGQAAIGTTKKGLPSGKGAPFFPDAIKTYNNGLGWVVETFPFNALDYLLAVEGALALRGAVSRTLAANSQRFAAFPFVFDSGEDFVDENNEVKDTASSIWLPLWDRPATFAELQSFICDAQARLPGKEARFSAEFARALRAQGGDAGFAGWQEFRFKMKASRVPWVCTGRYLGASSDRQALRLNDALAPLDESGFLDQFEPLYKGNKIDSRSPHPVRTSLNSAIEEAVAEPTPENALEILIRLFAACRQMALSESFREKLRAGRAVFFGALHQEPWKNLLQGLDQLPEFRIARALASMTGLERQRRQLSEKPVFSEVEPFLGSLLPLKRGPTGWYLPTDSRDSSKQAVWSGTDLCSDLARVLSRRYLDSLDDDLPALRSPRPALLEDILAFLNGELDDHRIARWTEVLSLIGWRWEKTGEDNSATEGEAPPSDDQEPEGWLAIPPAYAALRALLEVECEWQGNDSSLWKKRRSQRPVALLCQRSSSSLALAVDEALRWLSIWGVPNCWGGDRRQEKPRLSGRDTIRADHRMWRFDHDPKFVRRLAAAVAIPLDWRDRGKLFRAVTLPQTI